MPYLQLRARKLDALTAPVLAAAFLFGLMSPSLLVSVQGESKVPQPKVLALTVEPGSVAFAHADESVQLLVTAHLDGGIERDVTHEAKISFPGFHGRKGAEAVSVASGQLKPQFDGQMELRVSLPGTEAVVNVGVVVTNATGFRSLNFTNDVVPILSKYGCNAGGCHGKQSGQNGFKLSLLGADPDFDYDSLVKQSRGRRVTPAAPDQSLLLLKAVGEVAHGGGTKIRKDSDAYRLLLRWVANGMPRGTASDPKAVGIEVFPKERLVDSRTGQQLRVVAHFSDGSQRDVTREAEFKSQKTDILTVNEGGFVEALDNTGEGAIMIRYMGMVDVSKLSVPFSRSVPDAAFAKFQPKTYIDKLVEQKWRKLGIAPSEGCTDAEFIRRASLDSTGTLPTPDEVRQFLADPSSEKRDHLVDRLLERPEYADYWANMWGDLLRNKRRYGDPYKRGTFAFAAWIRDAFARNLPYDQFVRGIITAQGNVSDNPPVVWYREVRNPIHQVNDTAQIFLGTRVSCANCHNHPYEKMSQDDYWSMAAFFARQGVKDGEVSNEQAIFVRKDGDARNPRTGQVRKMKGLGNSPEQDYVRGEDPRARLVDWMAAPDNPYFAKAIVNRIWAHYMGVGLVEAIDDMRVTNPPTNPQLLDALAKDLIEHKFDLKHLQSLIMKSQAYGLSSAPNEYNKRDRQNYARYTTRRMAAEALTDAIGFVTGVPEKFPGFPAGTRAIELPDEGVGSYFLDVFGRSQRESACECERSYAPNLAQVLHLMNSPEIQGKLGDGKNVVATMLAANKKNEEIVDELFLRAFARSPRDEEMKQATGMISAAKDRKATLEDLEWTLLNAKEFLFNH